MKQYRVTGVHAQKAALGTGVGIWFVDEEQAKISPDAIQPTSPEEKFTRSLMGQMTLLMPPEMRHDRPPEYHVVIPEEEYEAAGKPTVGDYITVDVKKVAE